MTMMCRLRMGAALVWLAVGVSPLLADEEYDRLLKSFEDAQQTWVERMQALKEGEQGPASPTPAYVSLFRAYAEKHAGQPEAVPALVWLAQNTRPEPATSQPSADATWALQKLADYAASPAIQGALPGLRYVVYSLGSELVVPLFEKIRQENPDPAVKAAATFNLALAIWTGGPGSPEEAAKQAVQKERAGELFRTLIIHYPDTDVAREAQGFIYELKRLQIGMRAPEIVGTDVNEKEVKLSQFRGRVVVLDFWGFW
jgi:hypothetical protein